jgi:hypothetical protein
MGALGAAVKVAAPEAAAAKGKRKAKDPRESNPGSEAARQRQAIEDVKAARKPEHEDEDQADEHEDEDQADEHGGGGLRSPFAGMEAPSTGGGILLGVMGWALLRAWIGNPGQPSGAAGVKALLRAKFLNKTS